MAAKKRKECKRKNTVSSTPSSIKSSRNEKSVSEHLSCKRRSRSCEEIKSAGSKKPKGERPYNLRSGGDFIVNTTCSSLLRSKREKPEIQMPKCSKEKGKRTSNSNEAHSLQSLAGSSSSAKSFVSNSSKHSKSASSSSTSKFLTSCTFANLQSTSPSHFLSSEVTSKMHSLMSLLPGLSPHNERDEQLQACYDLCHMILFAPSHDYFFTFPSSSVIFALNQLLGLRELIDPSVAKSVSRALFYLFEAMPKSIHTSTPSLHCIPNLLFHIDNFSYVDVAEEALPPLEFLSSKFARFLLACDGINISLKYFDFFSLSAQESALSIVSNCCAHVIYPTTADTFSANLLPISQLSLRTLCQQLSLPDKSKKIIYSVSLSLFHLINNNQHQKQGILHVLSSDKEMDVLSCMLNLLLTSKQNLLDPRAISLILHSLSLLSSYSKHVIDELLDMHILPTLHLLLFGEKFKVSSTKANCPRIQQEETLIQSPQLIFDALFLISHLLTDVPVDSELFLVNSFFMQHHKSRKRKKTSETPEDSHLWFYQEEGGNEMKAYPPLVSRYIEHEYINGESKITVPPLATCQLSVETIDASSMLRFLENGSSLEDTDNSISTNTPVKRVKTIQDRRSDEEDVNGWKGSRVGDDESIQLFLSFIHAAFLSSSSDVRIRQMCAYSLLQLIYFHHNEEKIRINHAAIIVLINNMLSSIDAMCICLALQSLQILCLKDTAFITHCCRQGTYSYVHSIKDKELSFQNLETSTNQSKRINQSSAFSRDRFVDSSSLLASIPTSTKYRVDERSNREIKMNEGLMAKLSETIERNKLLRHCYVIDNPTNFLDHATNSILHSSAPIIDEDEGEGDGENDEISMLNFYQKIKQSKIIKSSGSKASSKKTADSFTPSLLSTRRMSLSSSKGGNNQSLFWLPKSLNNATTSNASFLKKSHSVKEGKALCTLKTKPPPFSTTIKEQLFSAKSSRPTWNPTPSLSTTKIASGKCKSSPSTSTPNNSSSFLKWVSKFNSFNSPSAPSKFTCPSKKSEANNLPPSSSSCSSASKRNFALRKLSPETPHDPTSLSSLLPSAITDCVDKDVSEKTPSSTKNIILDWIKKRCQFILGEYFTNDIITENNAHFNSLKKCSDVVGDSSQKSSTRFINLEKMKQLLLSCDFSAFEIAKSGLLQNLSAFLSLSDGKSKKCNLRHFCHVFFQSPSARCTENWANLTLLPGNSTPFAILLYRIKECVSSNQEDFNSQQQSQSVKNRSLDSSFQNNHTLLQFIASHPIKCTFKRHPSCQFNIKEFKGMPIKVDALATFLLLENFLTNKGYAKQQSPLPKEGSRSSDRHKLKLFLHSKFPLSSHVTIFEGIKKHILSYSSAKQRRDNDDDKGHDEGEDISFFRYFKHFGTISSENSCKELNRNIAIISEIWMKTHEFFYSLVEDDKHQPHTDTKSSLILEVEDFHKDSETLSYFPRQDEKVDFFEKKKSGESSIVLYDALHLMRKLFYINKSWASLYGAVSFGHTEVLSNTDFVVSKLNAKVLRELQNTNLILTNETPSWLHNLSYTFPFVLSFTTRSLFLHVCKFNRERCLLRLNDLLSSASTSTADCLSYKSSKNKQSVNRNSLLIDADKIFMNLKEPDRFLEFGFHDEVGTGLGPTLEFYTNISQEFCKKGLGMWRPNSSSESLLNVSNEEEMLFCSSKNGLYPKALKSSGSLYLKVRAKFKLLGKVMAKALIDFKILDIPLSRLFYKYVLSYPRFCISVSDLEILDEEMAKSYGYIQNLSKRKAEVLKKKSQLDLVKVQAEIDALCLDFCLHPNIELKKGGKNVFLTFENIEEYLDLFSKVVLFESVKHQVASFCEGFNSIFPIHNLRCFYPNELEALFCGDINKLSQVWRKEDVINSLKPAHGYTFQSRVIQDFADVLCEFDAMQQRQFLQFITGSPRLPFGGFKNISPCLTVVKKSISSIQNPDTFLPSVMTCVNYIKMPDYSSKEVLKKKLIQAIRDGRHSFHLS